MTITLDIPDASVAKATIEQGEYSKAQKQAERLSQMINEALASGKRSITVVALEPAIKNALEAKKYKVTYDRGGDQRDSYPASYTISWY